MKFFSTRSMSINIRHIRVPYRHDKDIFDSINLKFKEPLAQFKTWFEDAVSSGKVYEANAMVVATCTKSGFPSARYMLLKEVDERGFHFFSNYSSRKGQELEENPRASLLFYWEALNRQVRVEGTITRLSEQESEKYFHERPRESQISAAISPQSQVVPSRDYLVAKTLEKKQCHPGDDAIPKPPNWGGYVLYPLAVEFWQGQSNRLHDRIRFRRIQGTEDEAVASGLATRGEGDWCYERLAP
ncbi:Pyridoxamine-phosphate oxidase [Fasciola hepatica]|uniref:pyridoxal 5'-phosphate synthase n=1 Tax=Fasciola hepatica TaxID=6192 RepID=A0A4E0RK86_FASHE|nr:Pyridoxamine-phosphate oxidase [Fasciola hepatica]